MLLRIFDSQQNLGMTDGQATLDEVNLHFRIEFHQAHCVCDGGPALANAPSNIILGKMEFLGKSIVRRGFLNWIKPFTLEVLNKCQLQDLLIGGLADNDRNLGESDFLRGAESTLSCDEFVFSSCKSDDQGLNDSPLTNRFDQLVKLLHGKFCTRLEWAWDNLVEADILDAFPLFFRGNGYGDPRVDQCAKAFAKALSEVLGVEFFGTKSSLSTPSGIRFVS